MFQVAGSASTRTGVAPVYRTAFGVAIMVKVGMITSSPRPIPCVAAAGWSAAVPFAHATPCSQPTAAAKACSKRRTNGPAEEIQFDSMHSVR